MEITKPEPTITLLSVNHHPDGSITIVKSDNEELTKTGAHFHPSDQLTMLEKRIYPLLEKLEVGSDLLSIIGSYKDTQTEIETIGLLDEYLTQLTTTNQ